LNRIKEIMIGMTAIVCLVILGIFMIVYIPEASRALYVIVIAIAGLGGYYIPKAVIAFRSRRKW